MAEEIEKKLPDKIVMFPDYEAYRGCKDANEIWLKYGQAPFVDIIKSLKARPVEGLLIPSLSFLPLTMPLFCSIANVVCRESKYTLIP
jgi:hypothetical protein